MINNVVQSWDKIYDLAAYNTLASKGFGCIQCPDRHESSIRYSMITSPGYEGTPPAETFYYNSPVLQFSCGSQDLKDRLDMTTNKFIGIQSFHTYLADDGQS